MPVKESHAILSWTPADEQAVAHLEQYRLVPWLADVINLDGVRPYTADLLAGVTTATKPGLDPVLGGILARDGGVSRHICLMAAPGVLPPVGRKMRGRGAAKLNIEDDFHLDILTLGLALQGIPHTLHGGVLTMLVDAICGRVGLMHRDPRGQTYSGYTNVRFLRPIMASSVPTNGSQAEEVTVLVRTQISAEKTRGGRMVVRASIEGEGGVVYAVGESLVVEKVWKARL
ncbi:hypothetical protein GGR52DRAFT_570441 [Hypoxylon sp. FL1284]|nr:hypothetical protein GGR52DRAFT_570441 [Hypoxylon sp. FL1284]